MQEFFGAVKNLKRATVERWLERHPGLKNILVNLGWLSFDKVFRMGVGIVMGAWIARYLGPLQFGHLNYALAVITLFSVPSLLGLQQIVVRDLVKFPNRKHELLGTSFGLKLCAAAFFYAILALYAVLAVDSATSRALLLIVGIIILNNPFSTLGVWFQSQVRSKYVVWANNITFLLVTGIRIALLVMKRPLIEVAIVYVVEGLVSSGLQLGFYIKLHHDLDQWRVNWPLAVNLLKQSWPLILSSFAIMIYVKIDQVMLGKMQGMEATGVYAAAARISEIWYFIPTILASSLFPMIIRSKTLGEDVYQQRLQQYYNLNAGLAYALIVPLSFCAPWIVRLLYGQQYQGADTILMIHIWASLFVFLGVARGQWLVTEGLLRFSLLATTLGALSNILLNLALIPRFAGIGAAIATVISYALSGWLSSFVYKKTYHNGLLQIQAILLPLRWIPGTSP